MYHASRSGAASERGHDSRINVSITAGLGEGGSGVALTRGGDTVYSHDVDISSDRDGYCNENSTVSACYSWDSRAGNGSFWWHNVTTEQVGMVIGPFLEEPSLEASLSMSMYPEGFVSVILANTEDGEVESVVVGVGVGDKGCDVSLRSAKCSMAQFNSPTPVPSITATPSPPSTIPTLPPKSASPSASPEILPSSTTLPWIVGSYGGGSVSLPKPLAENVPCNSIFCQTRAGPFNFSSVSLDSNLTLDFQNRCSVYPALTPSFFFDANISPLDDEEFWYGEQTLTCKTTSSVRPVGWPYFRWIHTLAVLHSELPSSITITGAETVEWWNFPHMDVISFGSQALRIRLPSKMFAQQLNLFHAVDGIAKLSAVSGALFPVRALAAKDGLIYPVAVEVQRNLSAVQVFLPDYAGLQPLCHPLSSQGCTFNLQLTFSFQVHFEKAQFEVEDQGWHIVSHGYSPYYDASTGSSSLELQVNLTWPPRSVDNTIESWVTIVDGCPGFLVGPQCLDSAHARWCGFGVSPNCTSCPLNAICPGGERAWPLAGYWSSGEKSAAVVACRPPATLRCRGWDVIARQIKCGPNVKPDSILCGSCKEQFVESDGRCIPCHDNTEIVLFEPEVALVVLGAILISIPCILGFILSLGSRYSKVHLRPHNSAKLSGEFFIWLLSSCQVLAQVARARIPGLPGFIRNVFNFIQTLNLDISSLSPSTCSQQSPFLIIMVIQGLGLVATIGTFLVYGLLRPTFFREGRRKNHAPPSRFTSWLGYGSLMLAVCTYGFIVDHGIEVLACSRIEIMVGNYHQEPLLWVQDTSVVCYEGFHLVAAVISWCSLGVQGILLLAFLTVVAFKTVQKHKGQRGCGRTCWRMEDSSHLPLTSNTLSKPIMGYGQAWLRITVLALSLATAVFTHVVPLYFSMASSSIMLAATLFSFGIFVSLPIVHCDHAFGGWKRLPRSMIYITSALTALLPAILPTDDLATHPASLDNDAHQLPLGASVAAWLTCILTLLLPGVLFLSILVWYFRLVCTSGKHRKKPAPKSIELILHPKAATSVRPGSTDTSSRRQSAVNMRHPSLENPMHQQRKQGGNKEAVSEHAWKVNPLHAHMQRLQPYVVQNSTWKPSMSSLPGGERYPSECAAACDTDPAQSYQVLSPGNRRRKNRGPRRRSRRRSRRQSLSFDEFYSSLHGRHGLGSHVRTQLQSYAQDLFQSRRHRRRSAGRA